MSAEILRRAASLMRERAQAATPGVWETSDSSLTHPGAGTNVYSDSEGPVVGDCCGYQGGTGIQDGEHIASWHPAVALAVADMLAGAAELAHIHGSLLGTHNDTCPVCGPVGRALAVGRAYLGVTQ